MSENNNRASVNLQIKRILKMSELNNLKSVSVRTLEAAIAKAISELTKDEFDCSISNITYEVIKGAKFEVHLHSRLNFFSPKDKKSEEAD